MPRYRHDRTPVTHVEMPILGQATIHHEAHQDHEGFCRFSADCWCAAAAERAYNFVFFVNLA
jgi:hypothetical protein